MLRTPNRPTGRILLIVHPTFHPSLKRNQRTTEADVFRALVKLGYEIEIYSASNDLRELDRRLAAFKPDIVVNLLEEFRGEAVFDFHLVSFLEALGIPYTGCNPRGLIVSRNKFWWAQILEKSGVQVPRTQLWVNPKTKIKADEEDEEEDTHSFPLIVKFNREHASLGIQNTNVVKRESQLLSVAERMQKKHEAEILLQEFIPGREVTVSVWGNGKGLSLPPRELHLKDFDAIATEKVKFSAAHRRRGRIRASAYSGEFAAQVREMAESAFQLLNLSGYARFDFRVRDQVDKRIASDLSQSYLIDVNANPNLASDEDFVMSARREGFQYLEVVEEVLALGKAYTPTI